MLRVNNLTGFGAKRAAAGAGVGNSWSVDFNGTSQYGTATTGPGALPVTVFLWIKPDTIASECLFRFGAATDHLGNTGLQFGGSGQLTFHQPGLVQTRTNTGVVSAGSWQSVACACANAAMGSTNPVYYVDGSSVAYLSTSGSGTVTISGAAMALGEDGTVDPFDGKIAMVAVWTAQLGASEISEIHNAGAGTALDSDFGNYTSSSSLYAHWAIEDGSGTTLTDETGTANMSLTGSPTWSSDVPS